MLKTRVITAVIGFIIALGAITFGGLVYDVLITLLALLGWREFVLLGKAKRVRISEKWRQKEEQKNRTGRNEEGK